MYILIHKTINSKSLAEHQFPGMLLTRNHLYAVGEEENNWNMKRWQKYSHSVPNKEEGYLCQKKF